MGIRSTVAAVVLLTCVCSVASAQGLTLHQYQGAPTPQDGFAVMRPVVPGHLRMSARLHVDYANDPLVFENVAGNADSEQTSVVRDHVVANLALSLGLGSSALLYAGLPIDVLMKGRTLQGLPEASGTGLGDIYVGGRYQLFAPSGERGPMIAVDGQVTLPSAQGADEKRILAGESHASVVVRALVEASLASMRVSLAAGGRFRGDTRIGNLRVRDEVVFELSVMQPLVHDVLFLHVEGYGKSALDDFGRIATTPISALIGLRLAVAQLTFGLAGGAGITRGYGAPDVQVVATVAVTHPSLPPTPMAPERDRSSEDVEPEPDEPQDELEREVDADASSAERPLATDEVESVEPSDAGAEVEGPLQPQAPAQGSRRQWADSDADGLRDDDDACPHAPGTEAQHGCPRDVRLDLDAHTIELLKDIKFNPGGSAVLGRSFPVLEEVQGILDANPRMQLRIDAYTHSELPSADAWALTQARAGAVRDLLIEWGIDPTRLSSYGCGSQRPIAPNSTGWGKKKNERMELHVSEAALGAPEGCRPSP